jgi:hypothetical protein
VFVGTAVERVKEPIGGSSVTWTVDRIAVNRPLHGAVESVVTLVREDQPSAEEIKTAEARGIVHWEGWSSCDYHFEAKRQYIIFAKRTDDGRWTTSACSGTKLLENAAEDLKYIATIPGAPTTGRVYGVVERMVADPADSTKRHAVPATGVPVELVHRSNRLTVLTDAQGKLDVQVPPGD